MKRYRQLLDRLHALALGPTLLLFGLPLGSLLYGLQQHTFRPLLWAAYCLAAMLMLIAPMWLFRRKLAAWMADDFAGWRHERARGKWAFALRLGLLWRGLPLALFSLTMLMLGYAKLPTPADVLFNLVSWGVAGVVFTSMDWNAMERAFRRRHPTD
ncbi:hypothetical protein NH8B_0422 [Pseudogulbenkiania sp. NH8B]|uniref:hypothetical protein n=1 Tax=Pseudogulbenkiania sp. (strain NH8B) TaxID=748280 RepID=UPI0002279377|nr:hypothetical protein [Pseudogulbenkiania sp. NH8B]BAK75262.1 hypothetical protein NH8B_0422 [Pseudogulbenkiania sp. NH8B]